MPNFYLVWVLTQFSAGYSVNSCSRWSHANSSCRSVRGTFSNIILTRSMFSSERAVLLHPDFSLFLFRLIPYERYFLTFCWIVFLQGGAWIYRWRNSAWTIIQLFLSKYFSTLVLLMITETLQPWIFSRKSILEYFFKHFISRAIQLWLLKLIAHLPIP